VNIKFNISNNEFEKAYNAYMDLKIAALKQLYHSLGLKYRQFVRGIIPTDNLAVFRAFRYRVVPTKYDIRISCGILFNNDYTMIKEFYNWLLIGSKPHWVSLKHLNVLRWSLDNGIIQESGGKYYFVQHPLYYSSGTPKSTRAVMFSSKPVAPYLQQIQRETLRQLREDSIRILKGTK